jgi:hypothetical protein
MSTTRRRWLQGVTAASLAPSPAAQPGGEFQLFWGDLHNHNAVGYAQGSLERTYDVARSHLDFFAFTPHAQWHDMPHMPNNAHQKWVDGFRVTQDKWARVQQMAKEHNQSGKFVSILAYEWHSSGFGDYCLYYRDDGRKLAYFDHVRDLLQYAAATQSLAIPHHLGYKPGMRGANLQYLDPAVSPVVEIYSEHGLAESDRGPHDYIRHSNGPRWTKNTLATILARGLRVGVIASSDDHMGYPGAYGEGLIGAYASGLDRASIFEALRGRRTIAATGDRIGLMFRVNGRWMGSAIPFAAEREIQVDVTGADEIEGIEVVKDGRVIHRHFPADSAARAIQWPGEFLCRVEFGWGPWAALNMARVCDWEAEIRLRDGRLLDAIPCFQAGPYDEQRRNRILARDQRRCRFQLYTSRRDAFEERATNAVVLRLEGGRQSQLELALTKPAVKTAQATLGELAESNWIDFTGPFTSESFVIHRLVTADLFRARFRFTDKGARGQTNWYMVRVKQANGHQAWSSPVWVEA